ncbi:hypothetical protein RCL1_006131 [Eukaryota sp. TZLM3-RCL]
MSLSQLLTSLEHPLSSSIGDDIDLSDDVFFLDLCRFLVDKFCLSSNIGFSAPSTLPQVLEYIGLLGFKLEHFPSRLELIKSFCLFVLTSSIEIDTFNNTSILDSTISSFPSFYSSNTSILPSDVAAGIKTRSKKLQPLTVEELQSKCAETQSKINQWSQILIKHQDEYSDDDSFLTLSSNLSRLQSFLNEIVTTMTPLASANISIKFSNLASVQESIINCHERCQKFMTLANILTKISNSLSDIVTTPIVSSEFFSKIDVKFLENSIQTLEQEIQSVGTNFK